VSRRKKKKTFKKKKIKKILHYFIPTELDIFKCFYYLEKLEVEQTCPPGHNILSSVHELWRV
jgi:hypothetical protein